MQKLLKITVTIPKSKQNNNQNSFNYLSPNTIDANLDYFYCLQQFI